MRPAGIVVFLLAPLLAGPAWAAPTWLDCSTTGDSVPRQFRIHFDEAQDSGGLTSAAGDAVADFRRFSPTEIRLGFGNGHRVVTLNRVSGQVSVQVYDATRQTTQWGQGTCAVSASPAPALKF